jgi:hypothetical protein
MSHDDAVDQATTIPASTIPDRRGHDFRHDWGQCSYSHLGEVFHQLNLAIARVIAFLGDEIQATDQIRALQALQTIVWDTERYGLQVAKHAGLYDFPGLRANGHRSILNLARICIIDLLECMREYEAQHGRIWVSFSTIHRRLTDISESILQNCVNKLLEQCVNLHNLNAENDAKSLFVCKSALDFARDAQEIDRRLLLGRSENT